MTQKNSAVSKQSAETNEEMDVSQYCVRVLSTPNPSSDKIKLTEEEISAIKVDYDDDVKEIVGDKIYEGVCGTGKHVFDVDYPYDWLDCAMRQINDVSGRTQEDLAREFYENVREEGELEFDGNEDVWAGQMQEHMLDILGLYEYSVEVHCDD